MSKFNTIHVPTKVASFGILVSIALFVLSGIGLFNSTQGVFSWVSFFCLSLMVGIVVSFLSPSPTNNGGIFVAAIGIFLLMLLITYDMYDESINMYSGGFEVGNGFLLDGLAQVAYVYILPLLYLVYVFLLSINIKNKLKRK